mmetsp:Transcript_84512/g.244069  ORF Transcript_84512/g.244069 Transcript_84512/m.244069 type:complete len:276 (-) Transcript_84512:1348-2175(-)
MVDLSDQHDDRALEGLVVEGLEDLQRLSRGGHGLVRPGAHQLHLGDGVQTLGHHAVLALAQRLGDGQRLLRRPQGLLHAFAAGGGAVALLGLLGNELDGCSGAKEQVVHDLALVHELLDQLEAFPRRPHSLCRLLELQVDLGHHAASVRLQRREAVLAEDLPHLFGLLDSRLVLAFLNVELRDEIQRSALAFLVADLLVPLLRLLRQREGLVPAVLRGGEAGDGELARGRPGLVLELLEDRALLHGRLHHGVVVEPRQLHLVQLVHAEGLASPIL